MKPKALVAGWPTARIEVSVALSHADELYHYPMIASDY